MDQNYVQYHKSVSGCHMSLWLPGGCKGGQGRTSLSGPVPPHSSKGDGSQGANCAHTSLDMGIRHIHADGDKTRTGQNISLQVAYLLPSSSVFPVYTKVHNVSTCILKCHTTFSLFNRLHQFSLSYDSVLTNMGSAFLPAKRFDEHLPTSYL